MQLPAMRLPSVRLPALPVIPRGLLPLDMFTHERTRDEAARARRLEGLYHVGQEKIWDGRQILKELQTKHGPITLGEGPRRSLAKVFSIIMWGELAAWKVSAQLAERIDPLEAKMAATSQAHDEARHFYVMHDYLDLLALEPPPLDFWSRVVVELAIGTENLAQKIAGMQLQVETIALTIFHKVRELHVEPVLSDLLVYYEKDEARHVGLGVQFLPELLRRMTRFEYARYVTFQLELLLASIAGLKHLEPDLRTLGIDARELIDLGARKQLSFLNDLAQQTGKNPTQPWAGRIFDTAVEAFFPSRDDAKSWNVRGALARARGTFDVLTGRTDGIAAPYRRAALENVERLNAQRRLAAERLSIAL
ncbi:hypothetical protein HY251_07010 [bacterium]|nr:hypothetical protein [bacterium]